MGGVGGFYDLNINIRRRGPGSPEKSSRDLSKCSEVGVQNQ